MLGNFIFIFGIFLMPVNNEKLFFFFFFAAILASGE